MLDGAGARRGAVVVVLDLIEPIPGRPARPVAEVVDERENVETIRPDEDAAGDAGTPGQEERQETEYERDGAEADANAFHGEFKSQGSHAGAALRAGNFSMIARRAAGERLGHAPISSRVRAQPRQKPRGPMTQSSTHGVATGGCAALEEGIIVLKD